jgi:hypothetical protein
MSLFEKPAFFITQIFAFFVGVVCGAIPLGKEVKNTLVDGGRISCCRC